MRSVYRNTWRLFRRNKEYMKAIIVTPVLMLFIFSFLFSYNTSQKVTVINKDKGIVGKTVLESIESLDGVKMLTIEEEEIPKKIRTRSIEFAVVVEEGASEKVKQGLPPTIHFIHTGHSEIAKMIVTLINNNVNALSADSSAPKMKVNVNEVPDKGIPINNSLGVIVFKLLTGGSLLAGLLINERKNGIKGRILLSGTRSTSYLAGIGAAYLISSMIASVIYYLFAVLFNFNFGMEHTILFLIILLSANLLSTALYMLLSAFIHRDGLLWYIAVILILPTSILSGAFWPFSYMPEIMQMIGNCFPQRWIVIAIEKLQSGLGFSAAVPYLLAIVALSVLMFFIAAWKTRQKRSFAY
jgi:ABC-2 type transport system permease protein